MTEMQMEHAEKQPELALGEEKAALEARLEQIKKIEEGRAAAARTAALAPVLAAIKAHGFTAAELGFTPFASKADAVPEKSDKRNAVAPRYKDPINGKTWAGRGKTPGWLTAALGDGKAKDDFLIVKPIAPAEPSPGGTDVPSDPERQALAA